MAGIVRKLRVQSGFSSQDVAAHLSMAEEEYLRYEDDSTDIPFDILERLSDLYHVEEYDILTGTAKSHTWTDSPKKEKELIPFFKIVSAYIKMDRLLRECNDKRK